jgi:hypothetical protein
VTVSVGRFGARATFNRVEQSHIQIGADETVKQERLALLHGILIVPEGWQAIGNEMIQRFQRISARDRQPERLQITEMSVEPVRHERHHFLGDRIGFELFALWWRHIFGQ